MKAKKIDIFQLKVLGANSKYNSSEIAKVIELFTSRKIERFDTARNMISNLSSRGLKKQQSAKDKLDFYEKEYVPRSQTTNVRLYPGSNSFIKPKSPNIEQLASLTMGDTRKLNSFIDLKFIKAFTNANNNETRTIKELITPHIPRVKKALGEFIQIKKMMKIRLRFYHKSIRYVVFEDDEEELEIIEDSVSVSKSLLEVNKHNYVAALTKLYRELEERFEGTNNNMDLKKGDEKKSEKPSGWILHRYKNLIVDIFGINSVRGSSYISTPEKYSNPKCGLINIRNEDDECFRWCMKYHQSEKKQNDVRTTALKKVNDKYDYTGLEYPVSLDGISHFEDINKVCIYVYEIDEDTNDIITCRRGNSEYIMNELIYLLRIEDAEKAHYIYIKDIGRLLNLHHYMPNKDNRFCPICKCSIKLCEYTKHISNCVKLSLHTLGDSTIVKLPKAVGDVKPVMKFTNHKNKLTRPFIVYADTECTLIPSKDPNKIATHTPNSACIYLVCEYDETQNKMYNFYGENCIYDMVLMLYKLAEECILKMRENCEMELSDTDKINFCKSKKCHICNCGFSDKDIKVRDHDHRTGKYRGAAHNKCNINYYANRYLPVVMHNLRGYDGHLIIKNAYKIMQSLDKNTNIGAIPNSYEKFMSINIGDVKFIDSCQFMASSLEKLAENLYDPVIKYKNFKHMRKFYGDKMDLLCKKGHYPYEWVDSDEKLNHEGLPPIDKFYSKLHQKGISEKEYKHALKVYKELDCKTFKDYHDAYLKTDVLLLADVFENFRKTCHDNYGLDPANYISAPGLSWDALLLKTGIELELITDLEIMDMVERQKRGGLCFVGSKRYAQANNKYLETYDRSKPSTYLMYWDANNLYGWAMSQYLPYKNLKLINNALLGDILQTADDSEIGYIIECDLYFPPEIHDKLKEFVPAPETLTPDIEWFSEYQIATGEKIGVINNGKYRGSNKLVPHLFEHKNYVIHYRNLKFIVDLGVEVRAVHKVLSFEQSPWMKPYIDFNTDKKGS